MRQHCVDRASDRTRGEKLGFGGNLRHELIDMPGEAFATATIDQTAEEALAIDGPLGRTLLRLIEGRCERAR